MSIRIDKPTPEDSDWTVWLETEPDSGAEINIGNGPTRAQALRDAVVWLEIESRKLALLYCGPDNVSRQI